MTYVLIYLLLIVLPGLGLAFRLRLPISLAVPFSVLVSYALFLLVVFGAKLLKGDYPDLINTWIGIAVVFIGLGLYWATRHKHLGIQIKQPGLPGTIVFSTTIGMVVGYLLWAGPYLEIPSDVWWHLGRMQDQFENINSGHPVILKSPYDLFHKNNGYWYLLHASMAWTSGHSIESAIPYVAVLNPTIFAISVYGFAFYVFRNMALSDISRHVVSAFSVLFFVVYFGISVFSYIRYYALGPTMLSYVVYLASVSLFLLWLSGTIRFSVVAAALFAGSMVLTAVHKQEMMFLLLAITSVSGYLLLHEGRKRYGGEPSVSREINGLQKAAIPYGAVVAVFAVLVAAYVVMHIYLYIQVDRHSALVHDRMMELGDILPFLKNLYILDPTKNFYSAVTVWGLFVYLLFFRLRHLFRANAFLSATMLVPIFTMFNPVFVDFFLRLSWPQVVWRISYMLPLCFIGAYLLVWFAQKLRSGGSLSGMTGYALSVCLLVFLLFPFDSRFAEAKESRFVTLGKVEPGNDHRQWSDLILFLSKHPKNSIITDRVTGYMINGLSHHHYAGYKFLGRGSFSTNNRSYTKRQFRHADSWWLVVNLRDGKKSVSGARSGHWQEDVLKVSQYYSSELLDFIGDNPDMFELKWTADRINVYEVKSG